MGRPELPPLCLDALAEAPSPIGDVPCSRKSLVAFPALRQAPARVKFRANLIVAAKIGEKLAWLVSLFQL